MVRTRFDGLDLTLLTRVQGLPGPSMGKLATWLVGLRGCLSRETFSAFPSHGNRRRARLCQHPVLRSPFLEGPTHFFGASSFSQRTVVYAGRPLTGIAARLSLEVPLGPSLKSEALRSSIRIQTSHYILGRRNLPFLRFRRFSPSPPLQWPPTLRPNKP